MKAIIGKKVGMSQIFDENGRVIPVTVIEAGPCTVVQKKTADKEGYASVIQTYQFNEIYCVTDMGVFVAIYFFYFPVDGVLNFFVVIIYFADIGKRAEIGA